MDETLHEVYLEFYHDDNIPLFVDCEIASMIRLEWFKYSFTIDQILELRKTVDTYINQYIGTVNE